MKLKRTIILFIAASLFFVSPSIAYAATDDVVQADQKQVVVRGNIPFAPATLEELFDANYYFMLYPDIREAYGENTALLYQHFVTHGLSEGRKCSPYLDIAKYMANNADLYAAFGTNTDLYVAHYFTYGIHEGRKSYATPLDLAIQEKTKTASNIYIQGKPDRNAIKALYGQAILEISFSHTNKTYFSAIHDESNNPSEESSPIIISNDVVAIPWDYVENGYVTLDMIRSHCGDQLILVQNSNNEVTFIAGNISSRNVTDRESVMEAVQSFYGILNYPEDTSYLYLYSEYYDSVGNHIYRFESRDIQTGIPSNRIMDTYTDFTIGRAYVPGTVILKTDKNGNIIALSSTSNNTFDSYDYSVIDDGKYMITDRRQEYYKLTAEEIASELSKEYDVISYLPREYNSSSVFSSSFYKFFVKEEDTLYMVCVQSEFDKNINDLMISKYPIDEAVYYSTETPGEKSQPYDNLYANVEVTYMNFTDANGRDVALPVAKDEKGYYFCAPEYKLLLEEDPVYGTIDDIDVYANYGLGLYYIDLDNPDQKAVTIFSNMYEACKTFYEHSGSYNTLPTLMALYAPNLYTNNAYGTADYALSYLTYTNYNLYINDIGTAGHEATHAYVYEGNLIGYNYAKFGGAINEGYADLVGMIIQQKAFEEYLTSMSEKTGKSIDEVYQEVLEQNTWLIEKEDWYNSGGYDKDGKAVCLYKASDPVGTCGSLLVYFADKIGGENFVVDGTDDSYGSHTNASILSHIAYEMWNSGIESDYDKLLDIWYDTVYVMTGESTFYDVRNYIEASMAEKNYSQDQIDKTMVLFDEANITKDTQDYLKVPDDYNPEYYYTDEYYNQINTHTDKYAGSFEVIAAKADVIETGTTKTVAAKTATVENVAEETTSEAASTEAVAAETTAEAASTETVATETTAEAASTETVAAVTTAEAASTETVAAVTTAEAASTETVTAVTTAEATSTETATIETATEVVVVETDASNVNVSETDASASDAIEADSKESECGLE